MLPSGTYAESYGQDKGLMRTKTQLGWLIFLFVLLGVLPLIIPAAWVTFFCLMFIYLIAVLGLQIVTGYCGQVNLGQAAFMGVGGLIGCAVAMKSNLPFEAALIIGGLAAATYGLIFALPAVRVKGFYLCLTTIAAQFIFLFIMTHIPEEFFGGEFGAVRVEKITTAWGMTITSDAGRYYVIMITLVILTLVAVNITRSRLGRAFMAVRDNEVAAEVMGINITYYKFLAFAISSFYAGIAGVLLGYYMSWCAYEQFTLWHSIWMVGMLIVGGMGSISGAIFGTAILRLLQEGANVLGPQLMGAMGAHVAYPLMSLAIGVAVILVLIYQPRGLSHGLRRLMTHFRLWPFPY